jgi:hypothetical protein
MAGHIEHGELAYCQFGTSPAPIHASGHVPIATASDFVPFENIHPFGVCMCPGNPQVAAATSAAMGVLTPMPCVPAVSEQWQVGDSQVWVAGVRALDYHSSVRCRWGGLIQIGNPGRR